VLLHLGRQRTVDPYCVNAEGCGPTWGNSLFEDPAEFTYGMFLGQLQQRQVLVDLVTEALDTDIPMTT
jgi:pyruvate-ferredoxin/flavodoxin oxidoreductase